jgi:hypothetical protein
VREAQLQLHGRLRLARVEGIQRAGEGSVQLLLRHAGRQLGRKNDSKLAQLIQRVRLRVSGRGWCL